MGEVKWRQTRLGDYLQIKHGFAFKSKSFRDSGHLIVLTPGNFLAEGGLKLKGDKEKYYEGDFPLEYLLEEGDLIVVMTDLTQNAPILGSAAFIPSSDRFLHNQRLGKVIDLDDKNIDKGFLYFLFNYHGVREQLKSTATGATVRHTAPDRIYAVQVALPPLATQRKIAAILSAYDDLIENNTRRIAILEEMARLIYREWFVHFRFPGHEGVEMVETEVGLVPEGWGVAPIGDVVETVGGGTPSTKQEEYWDKGDIVWYTPSDLTAAGTMFMTDSSRHINEMGLNNSSAKMFPPYSMMMTSRATLGVTSINTTPACTNQGFITCVPNERLSVYQLYFWVEENMETIINLAGGATYKEIRKTTFREMPIVIPDQSVSERFNELIVPIGAQIETLQRKNGNLRETRDLLLPRLVSGEVDVTEVGVAGVEENDAAPAQNHGRK